MEKYNPEEKIRQSSFVGLEGEALPCLFRNNADNASKELVDKEEQTNVFSSPHKKTAHALYENVSRFVKQYGADNVGFFTLTFPDNVVDHKEAYRRFNNFRRGFLSRSEYFGAWIAVKERQKRGAWHYHLVIDLGQDIRTGFDFEKVRSGDYSSANSHLRKLWSLLREKCPKYGFGRSNLEPIKGNAESLGRYVGKYIGKHIENRKPEDKHVKLVTYSGRWARSSSNFQWYTDRSLLWRLQVKGFAICCGFESMAEIAEVFGSSWAYHIGDSIINGKWYLRSREMTFYDVIMKKRQMREFLESNRPTLEELIAEVNKLGTEIFERDELNKALYPDFIDCPDFTDDPPF